MRTARVLHLAFIAAFALPGACVAGSTNEAAVTPPTAVWSLRFDYKPSGMPAPGWSVPWSTTIDSSGRCELSVKRWDDQQDNFILVTEPRPITAADLSALHAALQDARLDELAPSH